ncbi:MAG: hypothetical protein FWF29_03375, partial [Treponema sp.]|nr:hypothetical protein [Treponema sp.]
MTVYEVKVTPVGTSGTDTASIRYPFCAAGSVGISYTLDNSGAQSNTLTFSGVANPPAQVTAPGSGSRSYAFNEADAVNGIINITATFEHTSINPNAPTIRVSNVEGRSGQNITMSVTMENVPPVASYGISL